MAVEQVGPRVVVKANADNKAIPLKDMDRVRPIRFTERFRPPSPPTYNAARRPGPSIRHQATRAIARVRDVRARGQSVANGQFASTRQLPCGECECARGAQWLAAAGCQSTTPHYHKGAWLESVAKSRGNGRAILTRSTELDVRKGEITPIDGSVVRRIEVKGFSVHIVAATAQFPLIILRA